MKKYLVGFLIVLIVFLSLYQYSEWRDIHYQGFRRHHERNRANESGSQIIRNLQDFPPVQLYAPYPLNSSRPKLQSDFAFVTILLSSDFLPALEVFLYSLNGVGSQYPLIVCVLESVIDLLPRILQICQKYPNTLEIVLYIIPYPQFFNESSPSRLSIEEAALLSLSQIALFGLSSSLDFSSRLLFVDIGMIFLQNIDTVFTSFPNTSRLLVTVDWSRYVYDQTSDFLAAERVLSSAVVLFSPDREIFDQLRHPSVLRQVLERKTLDWRQYFPAACCLPLFFNVPKTLQREFAVLWHFPSIFLLRFDGERPWKTWSTPYYRDVFVSAEEKSRRRSLQQWDANDHQSLHSLWREKYLSARQRELSQSLRIFQGYHAKKCWKDLIIDRPYYRQIRLNGPLYRSELDYDAVALYPPLRQSNLQLALGEFGAMLAIASLPVEDLPPFLGFTSWKENIKQNWKEGASIDWTKIDLSTNAIYFWYSLYHPPDKSFLDMVEMHHPGMGKIFQEISPIPCNLSSNHSHRYVYGNYFILETRLFLDYMRSAQDLMHRFFLRHPIGSPCPYSVPSDTEHPAERCVGYLLERFLNLWAEYRQLRFVFAVDEPLWRNS